MNRDRLKANIEGVRLRIAEACRRAGRKLDDVTLVAVTKTVEPAVIEALGEFGIADCAENRVLEGLRRTLQVGHPYRWHFIGHIQTNKAKRVIERFGIVHSIDRWEVAEEIQKQLERANKSVAGFVQVNVSGEQAKGGVTVEQAPALVDRVRRECPRIGLVGLMTMAPFTEDPAASRPHFRRLRELAKSVGLKGLSMGMTADFEPAVEEGATHVRIGTALFEGVGSISSNAGLA